MHQIRKVLTDVGKQLRVHLFQAELERHIDRFAIQPRDVKVFNRYQLHGLFLRADNRVDHGKVERLVLE